eukprot:gene7483-9580_t
MKLAAKVGFPRCAVKEVSAGSLSTQHLQEFRYELNLLSNLKHPNLPRIHSVYDTYGTESHVGKSGNNRSIVYVVMDPLNGGELLPALCRQRQYLESDAACLVRQLVSTVSYLHKQGISHSSLVPENLVLSRPDALDSSSLRLVGFGRSESEMQRHPSPAVSGDLSHLQELRVPEVLYHYSTLGMQGPTSFSVREKMAVDVWCVGALAHLLLSGLLPGEEGGSTIAPRIHSRKESIMSVSNSTGLSSQEDLELNLLPRFRARQWMFVSDEAKDFLHECLRINPAERPSLSSLWDHPWLQTVADKPDLSGVSDLPSEMPLPSKLAWPGAAVDDIDGDDESDDASNDLSSAHFQQFGMVRHASLHSDAPETSLNGDDEAKNSDSDDGDVEKGEEEEDDDDESLSVTVNHMLQNDLTQAVLPVLKRFMEQRRMAMTQALWAEYQYNHANSMQAYKKKPAAASLSSSNASSFAAASSTSNQGSISMTSVAPVNLMWMKAPPRYRILSADEMQASHHE